MSYIQETQAELKHVSWPSRAQTTVFTVVVVLVSVLTSIYLGLFDYLFRMAIAHFIG